LLIDALCYTFALSGVINTALAGQIPEALDTVGYALLGGFGLTRIKTHVLRKAAGFATTEKMKGPAALLDRLWGAGIWIFSASGMAQILSMELGFRLKSVLALGGLSSLVFGLACQTPLANVVKGLIIAASGAFATGDKISSAGLTGVVEEFGWYQSRIRMDSNELVTLPNAVLADKQIINLSRRSAKKIVSQLRLRYEDLPKINEAISEMRNVARSMPGLAPGRPVEVFLTDYGKCAIEVTASLHVTADQNDKQVRQDFLFKLANVLTYYGIQFQPDFD